MKQNDLELFNRLINSKQYKKMKAIFSKVFGEKIQWVKLNHMPQNTQELINSCPSIKDKNKAKLKKTFDRIYKTLRKAGRTRNKQIIKNARTYLVYVFPLKKENKIFGYIILFNIKKNISQNYINIFDNYLRVLILKMQNDLELSRLYETIQPRTAALSTIHTIHRLISTALNLKELLPKIARLSLQVMRVKKCSIYLMSKTKKYLNHAVTVTQKGEINKKERVELGKELVGRTAKIAVPILTEDSLAMPLIEEDVLGVIVVSEKIDNKPFRYFDQDILTTLSEQAVIAIRDITLHRQQEKLTLGSIESLSALSGSRKVQPHISKIKFRKLVKDIAKELNLSAKKIDTLNYAALLHDVGKIGIPEDILKKNVSLTSREYKLVKQHPSRSAAILKHLKALEPAIPIILHHHENYDGSGYPEGLKREQIPLGARILSVVDALEAMITKRPYRRAKSLKQAIMEIEKNSGSQFDPDVVKALLKVIQKKKIKKEKIIK